MILIAVFASAGTARSQCYEAKLQEAAGSADDRFGIAVLPHDDVLFVAEEGADASGRVHVFTQQPAGWVEITSVVPADIRPGLHFGAALAASGDVLLAGSREDDGWGDPEPGGAWIFVRDRQATPTPLDDLWVEVQALQVTDPWLAGRFGASVALTDGVALVGAPDLVGAPVSAAAYLFVRDDRGTRTQFDDRWIQQARLDPDPATTNSDLGACVALMDGGGLALASDPRDRTGANGGVHLYARDDHGSSDPFDDTWQPIGQIEAPPGGADTLTGNFIVDDDRLFAAGFFSDASSHRNVERIDVYERSAGIWNLAQVIDNPVSGFGSFGRSMAADGDLLISGDMAWSFGPPADGSRTAILARVAGVWTLQSVELAPDRSARDNFGQAAALVGSRAYVGAPGAPYVDDDPAVEGAVWVVDLARQNGWEMLSESVPNDPSLGGWGSLDGQSTVTIRVYDTFDAGNLVVLVAGTRELNLPIGDDLLVPSPDLFVPLVLGLDGDVAVSGIWPPGLPPGFQVWFQAWLATGWPSDPWSASNALRATQTTD
jgi:hypothetical protein